MRQLLHLVRRGLSSLAGTGSPPASANAAAAALLQLPNRACGLCGAALQATNPAIQGYVPPSAVQKFADQLNKNAQQPAPLFVPPTKRLLKPGQIDDGSLSALHDVRLPTVNERKQLAKKSKDLICQRCSGLRSKGELTAPETPVSNLDDIKAKMALLDNPLPVVVVDVLDFPSLVDLELLDKLHLRRIPLSIIVNKYDLMPGDVRIPKHMDWVRGRVRTAMRQLDLKIRDVWLVSGKTGFRVKEAFDDLYRIGTHEKRDLVLIGRANVGKTTLLNHILPESDRAIVSPLPGTTLGATFYTVSSPGSHGWRAAPASADAESSMGLTLLFRRIDTPESADSRVLAFDRSRAICMLDTPGFLSTHHITKDLTLQESRLLDHTGPFKLEQFLLHQGQALMLGALLWIELAEVSGVEKMAFIVCASSKLPRFVAASGRTASKLAATQVGQGPFQPPCRKENPFIYAPKEFELDGTTMVNTMELVCAGIGWVTIVVPNACKAKIRVVRPDKMGTYLRTSIYNRAGPKVQSKASPAPAAKTRSEELKSPPPDSDQSP